MLVNGNCSQNGSLSTFASGINLKVKETCDNISRQLQNVT